METRSATMSELKRARTWFKDRERQSVMPGAQKMYRLAVEALTAQIEAQKNEKAGGNDDDVKGHH